MKYLIIIPLFLISVDGLAQISKKDSVETEDALQRFLNIYTITVTIPLPDSSFVESEDILNAYTNPDEVVIKYILSPTIYPEHIDRLQKEASSQHQKVVFRDHKKIGERTGFLVETENVDPSGKDKRIFSSLHFSIPHKYGSIIVIAAYPKAKEAAYRQKLMHVLKTFTYA